VNIVGTPLTEKNRSRSSLRKRLPLLFCLSRNPHEIVWARNRVSVVRGRPPAAWVTGWTRSCNKDEV